MSLKKKALKAAGYAVAPKLSFLVHNPRKAAFAKAGAWAGGMLAERMVPERFRPQRRSPGMTAAKGLGAAAIAAPLGWWLGRRMMERQGAGRAAGWRGARKSRIGMRFSPHHARPPRAGGGAGGGGRAVPAACDVTPPITKEPTTPATLHEGCGPEGRRPWRGGNAKTAAIP
ncbi:MAG TPA: hypothetical protein VHG91_11410 [Longimicrobium sp.]|nr:hypothetical protein [Longimicrobium sp.]